MKGTKIDVLESQESAVIREKFIDIFVDRDTSIFKERIAVVRDVGDGPTYRGYLWDCLYDKHVTSEDAVRQALAARDSPGFVLWDIHSSRYIRTPNYWKYPKESVLRVPLKNLFDFEETFPRDIYVFDDSYSWLFVLTHEYDEKDARWCLEAKPRR